MFNLYVGGVGSGKSIAMIHDAAKHWGHNVYTHKSMPLDFSRLAPNKHVIEWEDLDDLRDAKCGIVLLDEADMFINSRNFATLNDVIRRKFKEHRKDHVDFVGTTQHVSFVDKVARIFIDEARLIRRRTWPVVGAVFPRFARPPVKCRTCGEVTPDGKGDTLGWRKWTGCATRYEWVGYPATILGDDESAKGVNLERREENRPEDAPTLAISRGGFWFTPELGGAYSTHGKVSDHFNGLAHAHTN